MYSESKQANKIIIFGLSLTEQRHNLFRGTLESLESYRKVKKFSVIFLQSMHRTMRHSHHRNILYSLLDYFGCRLRQKSMVLNWLHQENAWRCRKEHRKKRTKRMIRKKQIESDLYIAEYNHRNEWNQIKCTNTHIQ